MATILLASAIKAAVPFWGAVITLASGYVDQKLLGPKPQAPARMDSAQLQDSSYGGMIPIAFGMIRVTGNIIFATAFDSHGHSSKGKGGGATSYSYTISLAVALCKGPIASIRRIWADGTQFILKAIAGNVYTFQKVSDSSVTFSCRLYAGSEDQLPDSYIEAQNGGAGTTPAYRGLAYVVFQDQDLSNFGNRIPQLQFEVVMEGMPIPINYSGQNLSGQTFTGDLSFSIWNNATLNNCTFTGCRLDNASFNSTTINNSDFSGCIMRNTNFNPSTITSCNFSDADARGTNFIDSNITSSSFDGADLRGASFD
jgi:uncharacterized protein YjbI with pentapeptide repeats